MGARTLQFPVLGHLRFAPPVSSGALSQGFKGLLGSSGFDAKVHCHPQLASLPHRSWGVPAGAVWPAGAFPAVGCLSFSTAC
jgi:hypothetical protein